MQNTRLLLLAVFGVFFFLKLINISPKLSDENLYFYVAKLLTEGVLPYQDFFFAHLPGQILPLAGITAVFGSNLTILKLVPIIASIGTASLLFLLTRKTLGKLAGIATSALFLFSLSVLATTDHGSGVHEATFFLALMWFLVNKARAAGNTVYLWAALAGLALFYGLLTRVYILPAAFGILAYYFWQDLKGINPAKIKKWAVFVFSSLILYIVVNISLWRTFGEQFLTPVWRYHFLKTEGIDKGAILSFLLTNEWMLLILAVTGVIIFFSKLKEQNPLLIAALFGLVVQGIFLVGFSDIYYLYLITILPFLAILAGYGMISALNVLTQNPTTIRNSIFITLAIFAAINFSNYQKNHAPFSAITNLDKIVGDIKGLTKEGDTIFGGAAITPVVALEAGLEISENQLDTNPKRYITGLADPEDATHIATESAIFIQSATLDSERQILQLDPDFVTQHIIRDSCELFRTYPILDYERNATLLWKCK